MLNKAIPLPFRDVLLHMMAINIYRMSTLQADCKRRHSPFHLFFFSIFFYLYQIFFVFFGLINIFLIKSDLFWIICSDLHLLPTMKAFLSIPTRQIFYFTPGSIILSPFMDQCVKATKCGRLLQTSSRVCEKGISRMRKTLCWNRGVPMASRRGKILLAVFLSDARFAHAAHHCFNSGALLCMPKVWS